MGGGKGALNIQKSDCTVLLLKASFNHVNLPFLVGLHTTTADSQNNDNTKGMSTTTPTVLNQREASCAGTEIPRNACICTPLPTDSEEHIEDHGVFCFDLSGRLLTKPQRFVRSSEDSAVRQQNQSGSPETGWRAAGELTESRG